VTRPNKTRRRKESEAAWVGVDRLKGIALVTGAASGIGAAISARLTERGWKVAGVDLRGSETDLPLTADVTDREALREAVNRTASELGPVSLLVTVAGYYEMLPVSEIGVDRWRRMLAVHLGGTCNSCAAVLPGMLENGGGHIITISSELALAGGTRTPTTRRRRVRSSASQRASPPRSQTEE
jgi:2-hydroxycyclohexanecarboxyl-CoA dehydrogenase